MSRALAVCRPSSHRYRTLTSSSLLPSCLQNRSVAKHTVIPPEGRTPSAPKTHWATFVTSRIRRKDSANTPSLPPLQTNTPSAQRADGAPAVFTAVRLPDLSQPARELNVEVPSYPDLWDSSELKPEPPRSEPSRLLVVAGEATVLRHGPSHDVLDAGSPVDHPTFINPRPTSGDSMRASGLWKDVAEELGVPTSFKLPDQQSSTEEEPKFQHRDLNEEERKGLWALLAFFGTVWVVGSYIH